MENTTFPSFTQQLFRRIYTLFTFMIIILSITLFLFWKSENNSDNLYQVQLPHWQKNTAIIHKKQQIQTIISQLLLERTALNYKSKHQQLQLFLQQLSSLFSFKSALYNDILEQNEMLDKTVYRLVKNNTNNEQVKTETQIELHLILSSLKDLRLQKQHQQQLLRQQIIHATVANDSTIHKVKAYARATQQLLTLGQLQQLFMVIANNVNQLSILSSPAFLDKIATQSKQAISDQQSLVIDNIQKNDYLPLNEQISRLDKLLFKKQLLIAKWRGALRYAQRYHQSLENWVDYFNEIKIAKPFQLKSSGSLPLLRQQLIVFIQQYYPHFSPQNLLWFTVFIVIFCLYLSFLFLIRLKKQLLHNIHKILQLIQSNTADHQANKTIISYNEEAQILSAITQLDKSQGVDHNALVLQQKWDRSLTLLALQTDCGYWSLPWSEMSEQQQANLHLVITGKSSGKTAFKRSWRHYFSTHNQRLLLKQARLAKQQLEPQQIILKLNLNTANILSINVTTCYKSNHFFGCLHNVSEFELLQQSITQLKQSAVAQSHSIRQHIDEQHDDISKNISQLMLLAQSNSIHSKNTLNQLYRSLLHFDEQSNYNRLATTPALFAEKQSVVVQFRTPLNLQQTNFYNEIYSATLNANNISNRLNNHIYLNYQTELLPLVTLDSQLFQQTVLLICSIMLARQKNTDLLCQFNLHDKNSGQQIVHCSFTLLNQPKDLTEKSLTTLSYLSLEQEKPRQNIPLPCSALNVLFIRLQTKNINSLQLEQGVTLQFDLPLALSQPQQSNISENLLQAHYLLICADKSLTNHVKEIISDNQGRCHYLSSAEYLSQQYSIEQLTKQPIETIIFTANAYATEFDLITSHIDSLPTSLQPKLLILQSADNSKINQQGFYSLAMYPLPQKDLIETLQMLKKNMSCNNQLLSRQQCQSIHFESSLVEALVGIEDQKVQHRLQRLLQWLGLRVTVVANKKALLQQWKSGRFLLLFTDFNQSPFIKLKVGRTISRGLFFLSTFNKDLTTTEQEHSKNWQTFQLENYLDITKLTQQLAPWLLKNKPPKTINLLQNQINEQSSSIIKASSPFNLNTFVQNQGSVALAVYMIDEYLQTIVDNSQLLIKACSENDINGAEKALLQLLQASTIIAATDLNYRCVVLQKALREKDISPQKSLMEEINQQVARLLDYAKAI